MSIASKTRIVFTNAHPIQYFAPLYAYLNHIGKFAVTALYLSDYSVHGPLDRAFGHAVRWDVDLLSDYVAHFAKEICLRMNRWYFDRFERDGTQRQSIASTR